MTVAAPPDPATVLPAWGLSAAAAEPLGRGLINDTWRVALPTGFAVLQRVSALFPPEVNLDIHVVTRHLRAKGLVAPELLPTRDGRLWVEQGGRAWRLMTGLAGESHDRLADARQARSAGSLLARFHRALADLDHAFHGGRAGVHDTPRHLANLRQALATHGQHPSHGQVAPLAAEILDLAAALPALPGPRTRIVHGDPKVNNILFAADGITALALVDLDTLGPMALPLELGDAFRSWCNPGGEDDRAATFDLALFQGAVTGYGAEARGWIDPVEVAAIVPATLTIYVELAARFCADALNESYFGWDPARFPSRSHHNQIRARSQVAAARSLKAQQAGAEAAVARAFAP